MSKAKQETIPGAGAAALMHWLALVSGLAVLTVERIDVPEKVLPIWIGGVLGTAFGQLLARRRMRLWLSLVIIPNTMFFAALLTAPFWLPYGRLRGDELGLTMLSFAPAAVSAYLALGDRSALAGIWFPVVLWTLSVLDHAGTVGSANGARFLLLGGPVLMILGGFYAHETRRVALWRGGGTTETNVLREAPAAALVRGLWTLVIAVGALALTSWLAPRLWHTQETTAHASVASAGGGGGLPCCPEITTHADRVEEYFAPLDAYARPVNPFPNGCAACGGGTAQGSSVKGAVEAPGASGSSIADGPRAGSTVGAGGVDNKSELGWSDSPAKITPPPTATATPPSVAPTADSVAQAAPAIPRDESAQHGSRSGALATPPLNPDGHAIDTPRRVAAPAATELHSLIALVVLIAAGAALNLASRPLRRALAVRHLREPIWPEPIDQRVSNLWQLALVGLRDGGFMTSPGEGPSAIARRSGLPEMATCATVLERARHGVRLDPADVDAMRRAATSAYDHARSAAGVTGRALGQLRWPLV